VSYESLAAIVEGCRDEIIAFTRELVAIATENPPGNHYQRCSALLMARLEALGMRPRMLGECVVASVGTGERVLRFHGHYDVVPHAVPGQFEPRIEGANLFGRGSSDMKGGLAAMIYAAHAVQRSGIELDGRIELVMVPDEETGGQRGTASLERSGFLNAGGAGMLSAEPTSGVVWNASRGAISLRVTVHGKAAHVGLSCQGVNAFEAMMRVARELEELKIEVERRETAYRITPHAARRSILMMGGECRGGSNFNLVPESCSFTVDRRFNPEEDSAEVKARLFDLFDRLRQQGIALDIEILQEGGCSGTPETHPLGRTLAQAAGRVTGKLPDFELCPGLLESRFYAANGIPAFAYGPGLLSVSHGPNEFVPIRNLLDYATIYAMTATDYLEKYRGYSTGTAGPATSTEPLR
jgi:succinyl-diaminopimelate desuccinylase